VRQCVSGGGAISDACDVVDAAQPKLRACHDEYAKQHAPLIGSMMLTASVDAEGRVSRVRASGVNLNPIRPCLRQVVQKLVFAPPKGGFALVSVPVTFLGKRTRPTRKQLAGMVLVPAGKFWMGCAPSEGDCKYGEIRHEIDLSAFYIDKTEVTVRAYAACVKAGRCSKPNPVNPRQNHCTWASEGKDDHPVNCVDWQQATRYCQHVGSRLPSEAEWEKAARGSSANTYPWGNTKPKDHACWGRRQRRPVGTCAVGDYSSGNSPYGGYDMAGNVWEWVNDWDDAGYYDVSPKRDPKGPSRGLERIIRGGAWVDVYPATLRSSLRAGAPPARRRDYIGFRCARSAR